MGKVMGESKMRDAVSHAGHAGCLAGGTKRVGTVGALERNAGLLGKLNKKTIDAQLQKLLK